VTSRMDKSKDALEHPPGYSLSALSLFFLIATYQKGFKTDLHGALQMTGSNCSRGLSGFSLRGVYKAPIGTTKREASWVCSAFCPIISSLEDD